MVVLAAAVWWKTRAAEDQTNLPARTSADATEGIVTVGLKPDGFREAGKRPGQGGSFRDADLGAKQGQPADWEGSLGDAPLRNDNEKDPAKEGLAAENSPALPPAAPVVSAVPAPLHYQVAKGDTFYGIVSRAYGKAPESLRDTVAAANRLDDPSQLKVGQELLLPIVDGYATPKRP